MGDIKMEFSKPWDALSPEEKRIRLYWNQKKTLDTLLEHHAITRAQYEKSLGDLTLKMKIDPNAPHTGDRL